MSGPVLSVCIPTFNRARWLAKCLEATLPQVEALSLGQVEVVVSDNASPDGTWALLQSLAATHPCMRIRRNPENNHGENFTTVAREAKGRFVWLMGDDDAPLPGAVGRILAEVQENPRDLYLMHALETDLEDRPLERRSWFRDLPRPDWDLSRVSDLKEYLDHTYYMAGVFGFISVMVFDREAWLEAAAAVPPGIRFAWPHVAIGLGLVRNRGRVRILQETLVHNRLGNDPGGQEEGLFDRIATDLVGWVQLADAFFADDPVLRKAFMGVMRRNTSEESIKVFRIKARSEEQWDFTRSQLLSAYYSPARIAQVELSFRSLSQGGRFVQGALDAARLCFADLGFVARGARRAAVLVRDPHDPAAALVLGALQSRSRARIRVYGQEGGTAPEGPGLEWRPLDLDRFVRDIPSRAPVQDDIRAFAPDLAVNADLGRHPGLDLLAASSGAVAAAACPAQAGALAPEVQGWLDSAYGWILGERSAEGLVTALGLGEEQRQDPGAVIESPPPAEIKSHAFLLEPDWTRNDWIELLLSYLDAFKPGEPVLLVFYLGRDRGDLTLDQATRRILEIVAATGRQTFPDLLVLDSLADLAGVLTTHPVNSRLRSGRGDTAGMEGPFGKRLAESRRRMAV